jgi:hypothetical protein
MGHSPFTDDDRAAARSMLAEAERRTAARETPPEPPTPAALRPRTLSNRRGQEPATTPAARSYTAAGVAGGLLVGVVLIVLSMRLLPASTPLASRAAPPAVATDERRTTNDEPAAAPATVQAFAAPDGVALGPIPASAPIAYRYGDSTWGGVRWQGRIVWIRADHTPPDRYPDLAPPTPAPTVAIVYVAPPCDEATNPAFVVQQDVSDGGRPLGQVVGVSCDSQADAESDAADRAAALRAALPTATAPPPSPTMIVAHPPVGRPKPGQPPVTQDNTSLDSRLEAAGWPLAQIRQAIAP